MSKISEIQKNGIGFMPSMGNMELQESCRQDEGINSLTHIIPTPYYYESELVQYDANVLNFLSENDVMAEAILDMIGLDLPQFILTEQSFDAALIFYKNICRMDSKDIPQISLTYEAEDEKDTRYFFSISIDSKMQSGALSRIRRGNQCIEFFGSEKMQWKEDRKTEQVLDLIRNDEYRGRFILDTRKIMNTSILMMDPENILNDTKQNEPLIQLAKKLEGYASFHILFDYSKMDTNFAQAYILEASDPKLKGAGVMYRNGMYELMQLYLPNEEHDGLILYDPEAEECGEHIMRTIYRTQDMGELIPLLYNMWNMADKGQDWLIAPLSIDACFLISFGAYPRECIKVGRPDGETTEEEAEEMKHLERMLGIHPAGAWQ